MRFLRVSLAVATVLPVAPMAAQEQTEKVEIKPYEVPWGRQGRPRDPYVSPDGHVYFVGQAGNYVARVHPRTGEFKRFEIDSGAHPHTLIVDKDGIIWYAGNRNGTIGRLDPKTGAVDRYKVPDGVRDPHTMVFDPQGNIWFTSQGGGYVTHFNVTTKAFRPVRMPMPNSRPYGIMMDAKGTPWFNLFGTNLIGTINPQTYELRTFKVGSDSTRNRRIALTSDGKVYYTDYTRGRIGRLDPTTGKSTDWLMPGGVTSQPYAIMVDDKDRLWVSETNATRPAKIVGFDPKSEKFFSINELPGERNSVRHMYFDRKTGLLWFGTDAGHVISAAVSGANVAM